MLYKSVRRLSVIQQHLTQLCMSTFSSPTIIATPAQSMVDEQVHIQVTGLQPRQFVTIVAHMVENKTTFESRGVYKANTYGVVDLQKDESLAGTYTGMEPMGLFWSIASGKDGGKRLLKKDVTTPSVYTFKLLNDVVEKPLSVEGPVTAEAQVERYYMRRGVKRIPVKDGGLRGTIFVPEGTGPFPALIDMSGAAVTINETRASVLASHGYAVFTVTYMYLDHLPKDFMSAQPAYIIDAARYFLQKPYVDETRFGAIGICYGGHQSLILASFLPEVRAVVDIGGVPITSVLIDPETKQMPNYDSNNDPWPTPSKSYVTEEGVVIADICDCPGPSILPAWQHGAKLLYIWGEDDKQSHPKWFTFCKNNFPEEYRPCAEFHSYPRAGHLIEIPYTPHCRSADSGRIKGDVTDVIPVGHKHRKLMSGGFPKEHAFAQVDGWNKIYAFLHRELCS